MTDEAADEPVRIVVPTWTVKGADSGIKTFLTELVRALQDVDGVALVLLCEDTNRHVFEPLCAPGRAHIEPVRLPGPPGLRPLTEQWLGARIDPAWGDVVLVPSNVGFLRCPLPQVVVNQNALTVWRARRAAGADHGLSLAHRAYFRALLGPTARRAALVVAVTAWLRGELLASIAGLDPAKVVVVHEGAAPPDPPPTRARQGPPRVLFASSLWPYKGAGLLVDALAELRRRHPELGVTARFVGKDPSGGTARAALEGRVREHDLTEVVEIVGNVPFGDMWQEYADADVLAYPSLLESFGLPPLEAMACGTPVVASSTPSVAEVVGDGAIVVDPTDPVALADALADALTPGPARTALVARGRARAAELTWDASARALAAAARSARK